MIYTKRILLFALLMATTAMGNAKPRSAEEMQRIATTAFARQYNARLTNTEPPVARPVLISTNKAFTVYAKEGDKGFTIVSKDDLLPEVLAVSDSEFTGDKNPNMQWWLASMENVCEEIAARGIRPHRVPAPDASRFPTRVEPLVSAMWEQKEPYWSLCPITDDGRCLTGCVATAISMVFYTNHYPQTGFGKSSVLQNGVGASADFSAAVYDYDAMLDTYQYGATEDQIHAVSELMLHCGVAVGMEYTANGSGAFSTDAIRGIHDFFGIETARLCTRSEFSDEEWMEMVYTELSGGHPMFYSGVDPTPLLGGGHAFVCDGYDEEGRVHMNWGWGGADNGYYNIDLLNPNDYEFRSKQDMILGLYNPDDVREVPQLTADTVHITTPGTLASMLSGDKRFEVKSLTVDGKLDANDMSYLKTMCGNAMVEGETIPQRHYRLATLNLSNAILPDSTLTAQAFSDCSSLRNIILPRTIAEIGDNAFSGCDAMTEIKSYSYNVPKMGRNVFSTANKHNLKGYVIAGSSNSYLRNAQWKTILTADNTLEFGTCIKANNANRKYGDQNPVLGYQRIGDRIDGTPVISCAADATSDAGKYAIEIAQGSIEDNGEVVYVPGTLTVQRAVLTVTAADASRAVGAADPDFQLIYDGFRNDDTVDCLTVLPTATTNATADSVEGTYEITVSGGEATNYTFKYVNGVLTIVSAADGIEELTADAKATATYNIYGQKVKAGTKGLVIINGRKYASCSR